MRTHIPWLIAAAITATAPAGGTKETTKLDVSSSEFQNGAQLPKSATCDAEGKSPALAWRGAKDSKSFALIADDPDAPKGPYVHWVLFDIPKDTNAIPHGGSAGVVGSNSAGESGFAPACPPKGSGTHHYRFHLYALDAGKLGLSSGASRADVEGAMKGHVIADGELVGTYQRR